MNSPRATKDRRELPTRTATWDGSSRAKGRPLAPFLAKPSCRPPAAAGEQVWRSDVDMHWVPPDERKLTLRKPDACRRCAVALPVGSLAWYRKADKSVACQRCAGRPE